MADTNPWTTQWDETITYLNTKFPIDRLGDHIESVVTSAQDRKDVTDDMSLGTQGPGTADKRHALRGLLLCQRVYYSSLWAKASWDLVTVKRVPDTWSLPGNWKIQSMNHWARKGERDILGGISIFVPKQGVTCDDLVAAAKSGPPTGKGMLYGNMTLAHPLKQVPGPAETCYRGVLAWLLQSGIVSMRWLMRDTNTNGKTSCDRMFGTGVEVWSPKTPFYPTNTLPKIEAGFIIHMWKDEAGVGGWNGHWVISNGDGTICGVNNGEVKTKSETTLKKYTKTGKLLSQWTSYGGILTKQTYADDDINHRRPIEVPIHPGAFSQDQYAHANMVKFDPLTLPKRM